MPIRFTIAGVRYEADTPQEVVQLQQALREHGASLPALKAEPILTLDDSMPPARIIFRDRHYAAFERLCTAGDQGIQTEVLVAAMELPSNKSLPPTVAAWRRRARAIGLNLNDYFVVERKYSGNMPQTTYRLTAEGRRVLQPEGPTSELNTT